MLVFGLGSSAYKNPVPNSPYIHIGKYKNNEIKKLYDDRVKVEIELKQYNIDRGQLQVYKRCLIRIAALRKLVLTRSTKA